MFCIQCGAYNPDSAGFCGTCGRKIEPGDHIPNAGAAPNPQPTPPPPSPSYPDMSSSSLPTERASYEMYPSGAAWSGGAPSAGMPAPASPTPSQVPIQSNPYPMGNGGTPSTSYTPPPAGQTPGEMYMPGAVPPGTSSPGISSPNMGAPGISSPGISSPNMGMPGTGPYGAEMYPSAPPPQGPYSQPGMSGFYAPTQSGAPTEQMMPQAGQVAAQPPMSKFAQPFPRWAFFGLIALVAIVLVVMQLTGSDWADGAKKMGIVAGIIAIVIAIVTATRCVLGMAARTNPKRVMQLVSAGVAVLVLLLLFLVAFTQQSTIHSLQARNLEGGQQWTAAINEFKLAGETAPTSDNIGRVYNEWGEQLISQQQYQQALSKFDIVLNTYNGVATEVNRAHAGKINAYLDWAKQASDQKDYASATSRYDTLLQLPYCNNDCQSQASALDATAYYNLAETQLNATQYANAASSFNAIVTRFPHSPEAAKIHADYAKALFGEGQQDLSSNCSNAVSIYQQLASQFSDTQQGQQASRDLKTPEKVTGHFTGTVPNNPAWTEVAALIKGLYNGISSSQLATLFYSSPRTVINSDGTFTFQPVPQGSYDLAWGSTDNATGGGFLRWDTSRYVANVGPLCTFDFGDIPENVPGANG